MDKETRSKQRVLIVDDEPRNQRIAVEILEEVAEYKVVATGNAALEAVMSFMPDLVLLDIMMPGIDGYETCKQIRANPRMMFTKIIFISGKAMIEEKLQGYTVGVDDYITKPYIYEELLAKVKVFLRLSKFEKEMHDSNQILDLKMNERTQQLYEAQAMLVNAAKMAALGEMAGGVAHEINNPLTTIGLLAEQIKDFVRGDPTKWQSRILRQSDMIIKSANHIATIVHGLRTFSRDGNQDAFHHVALKPIINDALNLCHAKLKNHHVNLEIDGLDGNVRVYCRPVQITQVLLNLISNSSDAIANCSERWIKIKISQKNEFVELRITDSGSGIASHVRDKIFQPLFTTKEVGKGTGLGLSISRGIVEAHRGSLTLNVESPYTEFVLSLLAEVPKYGEREKQL